MESAAGVTTRFAPRERNSRARRSPTSRATLSAAVATAIPRARAAPEELAARAAREGVGDEAEEHGYQRPAAGDQRPISKNAVQREGGPGVRSGFGGTEAMELIGGPRTSLSRARKGSRRCWNHPHATQGR